MCQILQDYSVLRHHSQVKIAIGIFDWLAMNRGPHDLFFGLNYVARMAHETQENVFTH